MWTWSTIISSFCGKYPIAALLLLLGCSEAWGMFGVKTPDSSPLLPHPRFTSSEFDRPVSHPVQESRELPLLPQRSPTATLTSLMEGLSLSPASQRRPRPSMSSIVPPEFFVTPATSHRPQRNYEEQIPFAIQEGTQDLNQATEENRDLHSSDVRAHRRHPEPEVRTPHRRTRSQRNAQRAEQRRLTSPPQLPGVHTPIASATSLLPLPQATPQGLRTATFTCTKCRRKYSINMEVISLIHVECPTCNANYLITETGANTFVITPMNNILGFTGDYIDSNEESTEVIHTNNPGPQTQTQTNIFEADFISIMAGIVRDTEMPLNEAAPQDACCICLEELPTIDTFRFCFTHPSCEDCMKQHIHTNLSEGRKRVYCPGEKCNEEVSPETVLSLTSNQRLLRIYKQALREQEAAKDPSKYICRWPDCSYIGNRPKAYAGTLITFICPGCSNQINFIQNEGTEYAVILEDTTADEVANQNHIEEKIAAKIMRRCPSCSTPQEKQSEGCNHVTCLKCRTEFCWSCTKLWGGGFLDHEDCQFQ